MSSALAPDSEGSPLTKSIATSGFGLLAVLIERRRLLVGLPLLTAVLAAAVALVLPVRFTAAARFFPDAPQSGASLASRLQSLSGLAAQFGVALPDAAISPQFYQALIGSHRIQNAVLEGSIAIATRGDGSQQHSLLDYLEVEGDSKVDRLEGGRRRLSRMVSTSIDLSTGVLGLRVTSPDPDISAQIASAFLAQLETFNVDVRRTRAGERLRFIEQRVAAARAELEVAEDALKIFLRANRRFNESSDLRFERDRLQRVVDLKQSLLTSLLQEFEQARIQEVNDTPLLTVVDVPSPPFEKSWPPRKLIVMVSYLAALLATISWVLIDAALTQERFGSEPEFQRFRSSLRSARSHPLGRRP